MAPPIQVFEGAGVDPEAIDPIPVDIDNLDEFTTAYLNTALWSENDDDGNPLDSNYGIEDMEQSTIEQAAKDCARFRRENATDLAATGADDERNAHDFMLTRNGHGAGFWDRGYGDVGDRLSKACERFSSGNLFVGEDGKVYWS